jgi:type I restriction enzyme S subunit
LLFYVSNQFIFHSRNSFVSIQENDYQWQFCCSPPPLLEAYSLNDNLEAQARAIFDSTVSKFSNNQAIGTFGKVLTGKTPPTSNLEYYGNDIPFIKTPDMHGNIFVTTSECYLSVDGANSQANKYIPSNTVIVACIGANAGEVAITSYEAQTNQQINSVVTSYPCFLYFSIRSHTEELRALGDGSSTMININKTSFENYEIPSSTPDELTSLEESLAKIFNLILANTKEIDTLSQMKELIVSTLSR